MGMMRLERMGIRIGLLRGAWGPLARVVHIQIGVDWLGLAERGEVRVSSEIG